MDKIVIILYFLWTMICPTKTHLRLDHFPHSPIIKFMSNRAATCLIEADALDKENQAKFEACYVKQFKINIDERTTRDTKRETNEYKNETGDEADSMKEEMYSSKPQSDTASERPTTLPGVVIHKIESGAIFQYGCVNNYYGTTGSQHKNENEGPSLEDAVYKSVSFCSKLAGRDIEASDFESVVKVGRAAYECSKDVIKWGKKILKKVTAKKNSHSNSTHSNSTHSNSTNTEP